MNLPLADRRIVVTRPAHQAEPFCERIEALGGVVIRVPTARIIPPKDESVADSVIRGLDQYGWIVFTSVNGVNAFFDRMRGINQKIPLGVRIAAVGPMTAAAVEEAGYDVAVIPDQFVGEAVAGVVGEVSGTRILLARAANARRTLNGLLADAGAQVDDVAFYDTIAPKPDSHTLALLDQTLDAVTFTNASSVARFLEIIPNGAAILQRSPVMCIGPVTAAAAAEAGLDVAVVARIATTSGLLDAVCEFFAAEPR
jgi:uroporphyrinogen-III synthase